MGAHAALAHVSEAIPGTVDFHDPNAFARCPRATGLVISPDGRRLVITVGVPGDRGRFVPSLWEYDLEREGPAIRVTRSPRGEGMPAFTPEGDLVFLASREGAGTGAALWRLPHRGEAEVLVRHPGGVRGFTMAASSGAIAYTADLAPGAKDAHESLRLRQERIRTGTDAVLYTSGAVRYLGRELGPEEPHLYFLAHGAESATDLGGLGLGWATGTDTALSPDGSLVAYTRNVDGGVPDGNRTAVVIAKTDTGDLVCVLEEPRTLHYAPAFTADGFRVLCRKEIQGTYDRPPRETLVLVDLLSGKSTDLLPDGESWPREVLVSPVPGDGTVWFTADDQGHAPIFRLDPEGSITRLTGDGAHRSLCASPDGRTLYALRSGVGEPPRPVRVSTGGGPPSAAIPFSPSGTVRPREGVEVRARGADGFPLRALLVLPEDASGESPAPLLVCLHGGPHTSWSDWSWEWNPRVFTDRGYAVLLPDPAMSTGYGRRMLERGWASWGGTACEDVLALTDAAQARPEVDGVRAAVAGSSFGGFLANRLAAATDRFQAIVSCSAQWDLRSFRAGTDSPWQFERFFENPETGEQRYDAESPHLNAARITAPVLVCHGGRDHRVPVEQSLALFHDVRKHGTPVTFLYFPRENHGVTSAGNLALRYTVILDFLDLHMPDEPHRVRVGADRGERP